jgi:hypothetical protein
MKQVIQRCSGPQKGPKLAVKTYIYTRPRSGWPILSFSIASVAAGQKTPSLTGICVSSLDWILRWPSTSTTMKSWTLLTSSLSTSSTVSMANTVRVLSFCQLHVEHCTHTVEGAALLICLHWITSPYAILRKTRRECLMLLRSCCYAEYAFCVRRNPLLVIFLKSLLAK